MNYDVMNCYTGNSVIYCPVALGISGVIFWPRERDANKGKVNHTVAQR